MDNQKMTNTPYDDVFRTLLNDCTPLIIPVINDVFGGSIQGMRKLYFPKRAFPEPPGRERG